MTTAPNTAATRSLWKVTGVAAQDHRALEGDLSCDVAVIGGGFVGQRAALVLAEAGVSVAVFEAGEIGAGASGRSGGQVNPMLPVKLPEELQEAVGPTYFERMTELSLGSADALFALIEKHGIDCDARQKGWLRADHCEAAADASCKAAQKWNRYGAAFEFVDRAGVRAIRGADRYVSGTVANSGGASHPMSLVRGLVRVTEEAGAQIFIHSRVASMDPQGDRWILHVNGHRVTTNRVGLRWRLQWARCSPIMRLGRRSALCPSRSRRRNPRRFVRRKFWGQVSRCRSCGGVINRKPRGADLWV